jgi:branched-chain amino acid transport system substrate-binding protein
VRAGGWRCALAVAASAVAMLVAACGNSDGGTPTNGQSTAAAPTAQTGSSTGKSSFSQENPGKADVDRSGEVIKIGFSNDGAGPIAVPEFLIGVQKAVDLVNRSGGVNGAKIKLYPCTSESTPESAINCANKSVEQGVALHYAGLDLGGDAALPVLQRAGVPYVTTVAWSAGMQKNPNAHILELGSATFTKLAVEVIKQRGVKSVSNVQDGGPAAKFTFDKLLKPAADKAGLKAYANFVNPANPDWSAAVTAAAARNAGAVLGFTSEDGCTKLVTAAKKVAFKGLVFAGSCSSFIKALGDQSVGTYTVGLNFLPEYAQYAPPELKRNIETYQQAMSGQEKHLNGFAAWSFSGLMELRSLLETIPKGPIDAKAVAAAFANAKVLPGFLGSQLRCNDHLLPSEPTVCRNDGVPLQVVEDGGQLVRKPLYKENYGVLTTG